MLKQAERGEQVPRPPAHSLCWRDVRGKMSLTPIDGISCGGCGLKSVCSLGVIPSEIFSPVDYHAPFSITFW